MKDFNLAAPCGVYCEDCQMKKECSGCLNIKGKPFWVKFYNTNICPIFSCCVDTKSLNHCGECDEFPCKTFVELRDPSMSDEHFQESLQNRIESLKLRASLGDQEWLKNS